MPDDNRGARKESTGGGNAAEIEVLDDLTRLVSPATEQQSNTLRLPLIPVACWRVDDIRFAFDSAFIGASTEETDIRAELALLVDLLQEHPGSPLSVFGHADPVGDDEYNKLLSGRRAMAVYGLLIANGDPDRALELWQQVADAEKWDDSQFAQMRQTAALPEDASREDTIRQYLQALCPSELQLGKKDFLAQGADPDGRGDFQGCGEFNPVLVFSEKRQAELERRTGKRGSAHHAPNRRVMVLLFRKNSRVDPGKWPCPRATEGSAGCVKRFWSDAEDRRTRRLPDRDRQFKQTNDTFACRFYQRLSQTSPCEDSQGDWLIRPLAWLGCHGKDLPNDPTFDRNTTTNPVLAFGESEHLELGTSIVETIDVWAKAGLIEGGAMVDVKLHGKIPGPVDTWDITVPDRTQPNAPYHAVAPMAKAHWHYIVPDPCFDPATGNRWTAITLKAAIKRGDVVVLTFGQMVFVGGDWVGSFQDLHTPHLFAKPVNVMEAVQQGMALARVLLQVSQHTTAGYGDLTAMLDAARTGTYEAEPTLEPLLAAFEQLRSSAFGVFHLISVFTASDEMPLAWSEIEKHATWLNPAAVPPLVKPLKIQERVLQILLTNGAFLNLALYNQPHFTPTNWDSFESGYLKALDELAAHLASRTMDQAVAPIPAAVLARVGFHLHYLTDAYSSGHMRVPRVELGTDGMVAKVMHDIDGRIGLLVSNGFGAVWRAYGDGNLKGPTDRKVLEVHKKFTDWAGSATNFPELMGIDANRKQAIAAVSEAALLVHYYAQSLRQAGMAPQFRLLDSARLPGPILGFIGDQNAPVGPRFPSPAEWMGKSPAEIAAYMRKHQPSPAGWVDPPGWPNAASNHPPLVGKDLQVNTSVYTVTGGIGKHCITVKLWSDLEIDFTDIYSIARVASDLKTPMPGVPLDHRVLDVFGRITPKRGHTHMDDR